MGFDASEARTLGLSPHDQMHKRVNSLRHTYYGIIRVKKTQSPDEYLDKWLTAMELVRDNHPELSYAIDEQIRAKKKQIAHRKVLARHGPNCVPDWNKRRLVTVKIKEEVKLEHFAQSVSSRLNTIVMAAEKALAKLEEKGVTRDSYNEAMRCISLAHGLERDMGLFDVLVKVTT